jgi:large subunit ribosomal protein L34e
MARPQLRSGSYRKMKRTTPGGRRTVLYGRSRKNRMKCEDGKPICGTKSLTVSRFRGLPKSKRRPERPFGNLSSSGMRRKIKEKLKEHGW